MKKAELLMLIGGIWFLGATLTGEYITTNFDFSLIPNTIYASGIIGFIIFAISFIKIVVTDNKTK